MVLLVLLYSLSDLRRPYDIEVELRLTGGLSRLPDTCTVSGCPFTVIELLGIFSYDLRKMESRPCEIASNIVNCNSFSHPMDVNAIQVTSSYVTDGAYTVEMLLLQVNAKRTLS